MSELLVWGGKLVDVERRQLVEGDVLIREGRIVAVGPSARDGASAEAVKLDARGLVVAPGLIDMHVHLREPGQTAKETIATGTAAAVAGGFTTVVCMPNTSPPIDSPSAVRWVMHRAEAEARCRVLVTGAITVGQKGEELAPIGSLKEAGVVAITDDGRCIQNHGLMRRALEYAAMFRLPVLDHCEDESLTADGVMHEGKYSCMLGLIGRPAEGEEIIIARNILLAERTGCHVHCQHVSCAGSVELLRQARARGVPISGEACPHHFTLTDAAVAGSEVFWAEDGREIAERFAEGERPEWPMYDTRFKMSPPLRSAEDREAILEALADGTLSVIATDHAPHTWDEKEVEFDFAPDGIIGLETALALSLDRLYHTGRMTLPEVIARMTIGPAQVLGLQDRGRIVPGMLGDLTLIDPDRVWTYRVAEGRSKATNSPFDGWKLKGKAVVTVIGGEIAWHEADFSVPTQAVMAD